MFVLISGHFPRLKKIWITKNYQQYVKVIKKNNSEWLNNWISFNANKSIFMDTFIYWSYLINSLPDFLIYWYLFNLLIDSLITYYHFPLKFIFN